MLLALSAIPALALLAAEPGPPPIAGPISVAKGLQRPLQRATGDFAVRWNGLTGSLTVVDTRLRDQVVFATLPRTAFLAAAQGSMTSHEHIGYFQLGRQRGVTYDAQTVTSFGTVHGAVTIAGTIASSTGQEAAYTLSLAERGPQKLSYRLAVRGGEVERVYLSWRSRRSEGYYGFGVQFSGFDMQGRLLPILVQEHGYGRGVQPLTFLADLLQGGAGGSWYNTYAPVPFYLTSTMQALYSENRGYQAFNLTDPDIGQLEVDGRVARGLIFAGTSPAQLLAQYTDVVGRMPALPAWTQRGLIVAAEGGTRTVLHRVSQLLAAHVPVAGLWIQDWSGLQRTSFGEQVVWNWRRSPSHYPHWQRLLAYLRQHRIRLLGYVNPFLVDTGKPAGPQDLYLVAKARGYLVKTTSGRPYAFHYPGRTAYLVDLTDPQAVAWLQGIIRRQLVGNGFSGWMADFGEELPLSASLYSGPSSSAAHNSYPVLWAKLQDAVLRQTGLQGKALVFLRSGFATSPRYATAFWLGDQLESWGPNNGLESSVTALLSAGLSGFTMEHGDLGGYTSLVQFPFRYVRTPALLMRWMEVDAFTPLLRSHEGNLPARNDQIWSSPAIERELTRMTSLYTALAPYRARLMQEAATRGAPIDRPLFFDYPRDPRAYAVGAREFMLGRDVLIAPVYTPNEAQVRVYLPQGTWVEIWSQRTYRTSGGRSLTVAAPIGRPAVFARAGTQAQRLLAGAVSRLDKAGGSSR